MLHNNVLTYSMVIPKNNFLGGFLKLCVTNDNNIGTYSDPMHITTQKLPIGTEFPTLKKVKFNRMTLIGLTL